MKRQLLTRKTEPRKHVWGFELQDGRKERVIEYADAYWEAARELAGDHATGGRWALPILFLARHAIELLVKAILMEPERDPKPSLKSVLGRSHNLREQVEDLKKVAKVYRQDLSPELITLLHAFEDEDPKGMSSRFPMDKKGKEMLDQDSSFDLQEFMDRCERAITELEQLVYEVETEDYRDMVPEAFEYPEDSDGA